MAAGAKTWWMKSAKKSKRFPNWLQVPSRRASTPSRTSVPSPNSQMMAAVSTWRWATRKMRHIPKAARMAVNTCGAANRREAANSALLILHLLARPRSGRLPLQTARRFIERRPDRQRAAGGCADPGAKSSHDCNRDAPVDITQLRSPNHPDADPDRHADQRVPLPDVGETHPKHILPLNAHRLLARLSPQWPPRESDSSFPSAFLPFIWVTTTVLSWFQRLHQRLPGMVHFRRASRQHCDCCQQTQVEQCSFHDPPPSR